MAVLSSLVNVASTPVLIASAVLPRDAGSGQPDPLVLEPGDSLYAVSASGTISSFVLVLGAA